MPMTIWRADYFKEVMAGLSTVDAEIYHFCLTAPTQVIRHRLLTRGEQQEGDWVFDQISKCVSSFELELFEERIDTLKQNPQQVAQHIVAKIAAVSPTSEAQFQNLKTR